jgi:mycothiol synthase
VPATISTPTSLTSLQQHEIRELTDAIAQADGGQPLSDQGLSQLASTGVRHILARDGSRIVGYAQRDSAAAEVLGATDVIDALLDAVEAEATALGRPVEMWAHGRRSRLVAAAESRGYARGRVLWQLRWRVADLPVPQLHEGISLRAFVIGQDETAWLAVNAAAFASHAEQGGWTLADIASRESEPWFDPRGFLLAERDGELLGFHWTKVHDPQLGEVYVLGVAPGAQGMHLGSTLLIAGLRHLREQGMTEVMLYVDDDNAVAIGLYERYGFRKYDNDVQYEVQPTR